MVGMLAGLPAGSARSAPTNEVDRLFRFPATNGEILAFTYAGNLYTVPLEGGVARRLTSHPGYEMFPRFSPDGRQIAFTAQYDGNTEVYLMPAAGGSPRRMTITATLARDDVADRMGPNNIVLTWKNQSPEIVFRSRMHSFNPFLGGLFTVSPEGGLPEQIPVPYGGFCSFSPDDRKLAYNRVFREFRTWKHYRGGMADDIWRLDLETEELQNLTENPAQDIIPMWWRDRIFFLSDRDGRMNLYSVGLESREVRQHTSYLDFDIKFPSLGGDVIVYEYGGFLYRFDIPSEIVRRVPIVIHNDHLAGRHELLELKNQVTGYDLARGGKRVVFGARGEVFTVPAEHGMTRNLTRSSGVHERDATWSPDGKWIAFISDASGENELFLVAQSGLEEPRQVTHDADTYYYAPRWSPDSRKLLWSDKKMRLRYVEVESGTVHEVAHSDYWEIRDYAWSPDSRWVAYVFPEEQPMNRIFLYDVESGKSFPVTEGWYAAADPEFSRDGKYLLFTSDRDFDPIYSETEWNHAYRDMERVYLIPLDSETPSPLAPENDEVEIADSEDQSAPSDSKEEGKEKESKDTKSAEPVTVKVDREGIAQRVVGLPIEASDYSHLTGLEQRVYYLRHGDADEETVLLVYDLDEQKETTIGQFRGYRLSPDGKKMLLQAGDTYGIVDPPTKEIELEATLDLGDLEMRLDRHAEWDQIFHECWRQMRDFIYAPNMHGRDWEAILRKYEPLVPYVNHRNDLTYLIGEMVGELNLGHTYVGGGDRPEVRRIPLGLLGAEIERHPDSGFFRFTKVLAGENWGKPRRSPLTEIGVRVREGDFLLAINGKRTDQMQNPYSALINQADKTVVLRVADRPQWEAGRDVLVRPIDDASPLYYFNWVRDNLAKVEKATDGRVGYLHIPDMGRRGLNEFVKAFYPQLRKQGLIIDIRGNGGGNVSPMIIERLRRKLTMVDMLRNGAPRPDPYATILGPMVCLMDEFSASDGDLFAYRFRRHHLGTLIGKRSWGGVVGIRGSLPLVDGGQLFKPEFAPYDRSGAGWIIEGHGVEPDIVVDNNPMREFAGEDQQLNRAIEVILEQMETQAEELPPIPPYPEK